MNSSQDPRNEELKGEVPNNYQDMQIVYILISALVVT